MNLIEQILKEQKFLILDGALGTQMQKNGNDINDSLWSAKFLSKDPESIAYVHKEYLEAGADCIITSSYQASFEGFIKKGFTQEEAKNLIQLSITLAQKQRDIFWNNLEDKNNRIKPLVAASIGPYGAYLANGSEYTGIYDITKNELKNFHKKRVQTILETKPDILACETIPSLSEAKIICEELKKLTNTPSWISFSAKNESYTNSGDDILECFSWLDKQNHISAVGINCTSPEFISQLIEKIKSVTNKPIVIYPNAGFKYNAITKQWENSDSNPEDFAKMAYLWYKQGASLIGGCCQTGPKEIEYIRTYLKKI